MRAAVRIISLGLLGLSLAACSGAGGIISQAAIPDANPAIVPAQRYFRMLSVGSATDAFAMLPSDDQSAPAQAYLQHAAAGLNGCYRSAAHFDAVPDSNSSTLYMVTVTLSPPCGRWEVGVAHPVSRCRFSVAEAEGQWKPSNRLLAISCTS